jgi:hypothetical protein
MPDNNPSPGFSRLSHSANSVSQCPQDGSVQKATVTVILTPFRLPFPLSALQCIVLVGDTSSSTLLTAYPQIAQTYPSQLACIFIRNTSATDPDDKLPYDTSKFQSLNSSQYFFYTTPSDLIGLDIANGQCVNQTIPQNVTFGEQGGPFRL